MRSEIGLAVMVSRWPEVLGDNLAVEVHRNESSIVESLEGEVNQLLVDARTRAAAFAAALSAERDKSEALRRSITELKVAVEQANVELEKSRLDAQLLRIELQSVKDSNADLQRCNQGLVEAAGKNESVIDCLQADLGLSLRLRAMSDLDLKDLQKRYADLLSEHIQNKEFVSRLIFNLEQFFSTEEIGGSKDSLRTILNSC